MLLDILGLDRFSRIFHMKYHMKCSVRDIELFFSVGTLHRVGATWISGGGGYRLKETKLIHEIQCRGTLQ